MWFERGERIARLAPLKLGACAVIWDDQGRILLTRRTDNGLWCLPGGAQEPGETPGEAVVREVWEETGLEVEPRRLIGVYSDPNWIACYADGNRWALVVLTFECAVRGGQLGLSDETTEVGYFAPGDLPPLVEPHYRRIEDALRHSREAFFS